MTGPRNLRWVCLAGLLVTQLTSADGIVVDKIYHPYVEPGEQELEVRSVFQDGEPSDLGLHRFGYGRAFGERWFAELYAIATSGGSEGFDGSGVELELRRQLTEQGEFWADWGVMFELERSIDQNQWELAAGILAEKEFGRWSAAANLFIAQEWGEDIEDETESRFAMQLRYRQARSFEPAVELHIGEDTRVLGPAILGDAVLGDRQRIHWEGALLFGLDGDSPDHAVRMQLEVEFR